MANKFISIEDEISTAETIVEELDLKKEISDILFYKGSELDYKNLEKDLIKQNNILDRDFFMVDLNLGINGSERGLDFIQLIRKYRQFSPVLVYSAHRKHENLALEAGADWFIQKSGRELDYKNFLDTLKQKIKSNLIINSANLKKMYCQIMDIDRDNEEVKIRCKDSIESDKFIIRYHKLSHFDNFDKIYIDMPILIEIYEEPGTIVVQFKHGEGDYFESDEIKNYSNLANLSIFRNL